MNAENWQHLKGLFHAAVDLDAGGRTAFLAEACAGRDELRERVEALLLSHEQSGPFLASSALVDAGVIVAGEQEEQAVDEQARSLAG